MAHDSGGKSLALRFFKEFSVNDNQSPGGLNNRHLALIAYLALRHPKAIPRSELAFKLWADSSEEQALTNLRKALHTHKQIFTDGAIITADARTLQLNQDIQLDLIDFTAALDSAIRARRANDTETEQTALETAVAIYRGDLLPNLYDEWIIPERDRLRDMFIHAMDRLIALLEARQHYRDAIQHAQRLLQADNLREETYRQLMRLLLRLGERASALRVYQICVSALETSLGVEPDLETRELYEWTLKDQVQSYKARITNLPEVLTSFIGRRKQVDAITNLLRDGRLITLTGPGGCGKTRLAIQVSHEIINQFPDGVWWVDLSSLMDEKLALQQFITALNIQEIPNQPLQETLITFLTDRRLLIVVDNCEHMIGVCAEVIFGILTHCLGIKILTTSREKLQINGEIAFQVPSLQEEEGIDLFAERAQLIREKSSIDKTKLAYITQVCRSLDGIPLAIELAAARVAVLGVQTIAERLDDRFNLLTDGQRAAFPRHKTLRATIDWSYNLLSEKERDLFCRLSVFSGGWTLDAAEDICSGDSVDRGDVMHLLSQLADKSLISIGSSHDGPTRYYLLETIRQYALELFNTRDFAKKVFNRHVEYFVALAERADPELLKSDQDSWLKRLDREQGNFRSAFLWALAEEQIENLGKLSSALGLYWFSYGRITEALEWLGRILARHGMSLHLRSYTLFWMGMFLGTQGNYEKSGQIFMECLEASRLSGNDKSAARCLFGLGVSLMFQGKYRESLIHLDESMKITRDMGDRSFMPYILVAQGDVLMASGLLVDAQYLFEESLNILRETADARSLSLTLGSLGELAYLSQNYLRARTLLEQSLALIGGGREMWNFTRGISKLGKVTLAQGDIAKAREFQGESLSLAQKMGDKAGVARALLGFVSVLYAEERMVQSAQLQGFVTSLYEQIGARPEPIDQVESMKTVESLKKSIGDELYKHTFELGTLIPLEQAISYTGVQSL